MNKIKIKKGDQVLVIAGAYKGTKGSVLKVLYTKNKALVEGVNIVKRPVSYTHLTLPTKA